MDGAGRRGNEAVDGFEKGGLAGAAAAQEDNGFAFLNFEGDVAEDGTAGEGAGEVPDFEERLGHGFSMVAGARLIVFRTRGSGHLLMCLDP